MRILGAAAAAAFASLLAIAGAAEAAASPRHAGGEEEAHFARGREKTLPPIGFVKFCSRNPADCRAEGLGARRLHMSGERWRMVYQLNSYVNGKVAPVSDEDLYGEAEYWAYPTDAGDCEDYVLMKKRYLEKLGFPRSALLITVVLDERNDGHAVLTLRTDDGDFVLDNRRNEIRRWDDLDYVYLKRQSQADPRQWVALSGDGMADASVLAGGTGQR
jgi:predicted transglutaminase-like cysteine proteinase